MAGLPKEIYIVVAEGGHNQSPMAFESENLDFQSAKEFKEKRLKHYGRCAIYKAVKVEDESK